MNNTLSFIQTVFTVASFIAAVLIPVRIMWNQMFIDLGNTYMGHEFALAVKGISDFFHDDCKGSLDNIPAEYKKRFVADFKNYKPGSADDDKKNSFQPEMTLHFQRRLIANFYFQLDLCSRWIGRDTFRKSYFRSERNMIKIIACMNKAVKDDESLYKDISTDERFPSDTKSITEMNRHLYHLYKVL